MNMKIANGLVIAGMLAMTAIPAWAGNDGGKGGVDYSAVSGNARVLTDQEIRDLLARSGEAAKLNAGDVDVKYLGAMSDAAIASELCCENINEVVTEERKVEETTIPVDKVTEREIIQPIEINRIQPVLKEVINPQTEEIVEDVKREQVVLQPIIDKDPVPQLKENIIVQEQIVDKVDRAERVEEVIAEREIIQPIVRTTIVPVQRRIDRPVIVEDTLDVRYETRRAPTKVIPAPAPQVNVYTTEDVTVVDSEEYSEKRVDVVTKRNVYQPIERTIVQPIERQILQPQTKQIQADTQYKQEVLPGRVEYGPRPQLSENVVEQYVDKTILEVSDVYVDRVTKNVTQPVRITTIEPVQREVIRPRKETIQSDVQYRTERLPVRVIPAQPVQPVINYIEQVTEKQVEDYRESYYQAVTQHDIIQPVVTTRVQPVEYVRYQGVTEVIERPVRYETVRADTVILNVGVGCICPQ
jgi:hypothetical protein